MRITKTIFSCIEIVDQPINYELFEDNGKFRVVRDGFPPTKSKMELQESIEYILGDIRNLRAVKFFEINPNLDLQILKLFNENNDIQLPEIYKDYVDFIRLRIIKGTKTFVVYGRDGVRFVSGDTIYFDKIFKQDIEDLKTKLKQRENQ